MPWSEKRVLIVASGPSAAGVAKLPRPSCAVIAVKGAIEGLPWEPDYWFSLDLAPRGYGLFQKWRDRVRCILAVDADAGPVARQPSQRADFTGAFLVERRRGAGVSRDANAIHHGNSAYGAMQIALHMGARRIAAAGVDGTQEGYWHGNGQPGNIKSLPKMFEGAAQQIRDRHCELRFADTPGSQMTGFKRMPLDELVAWVTEP